MHGDLPNLSPANLATQLRQLIALGMDDGTLQDLEIVSALPSESLQPSDVPSRQFDASGRGPASDGRQSVISHRNQKRPAATIGLPWLTIETSRNWIGHRILFWPRGVPPQRRIGVVSSRLGRQWDRHPRWFDLMRTAVLQIDGDRECLCVVTETDVAKVSLRAAQLFQKPCLSFQISSAPLLQQPAEILNWLRDISANPDAENPMDRFMVPVAVSPPIALVDDRSSGSCGDFESFPIADRLNFAVCDRLMILKMRSGGNMEQLIRRHLSDHERSANLIMLAEEDSDKKCPLPLSDDGSLNSVVRWIVHDRSRSAVDRSSSTAGMSEATSGQTSAAKFEETESHRPALADGPLVKPSDWLLHWTRDRKGPWPDQDIHDWLDELLLGCPGAKRSAFASLLRIISEMRLRSSDEGIRGGTSVVSFTEVPLSEFRQRRVYRTHRLRYDFEPWGIAIRRRALAGCGAVRVVYGDEREWDALPPDTRWTFQKATAGSGATDNLAEREWRIRGDLVLSEFSHDDLCCFVDTAEAAQILAQQTDRTVIVVPPRSR